MQSPDITVGVLSWKAPLTLLNSLLSYWNYGLATVPVRKLIFFQEIGVRDRAIARLFAWDFIGSSRNLGIAAGYRALLDATDTSYFLFLENDWQLIQQPLDQLIRGRELLYLNKADVVRLRHRRQPGTPLWSASFQGRELDHPTHLLDSVHWSDGSFEGIERKGGWFFASSKNANWTNNPTLATTSFLRSQIAPKISNGDIEKELQPWWQEQDFTVAQGSGLFRHRRLDR